MHPSEPFSRPELPPGEYDRGYRPEPSDAFAKLL